MTDPAPRRFTNVVAVRCSEPSQRRPVRWRDSAGLLRLCRVWQEAESLRLAARFVRCRVRSLRHSSLILASFALSCLAMGQSVTQFALSEAGVEVGFDPAPVGIPAVTKAAPRPVTSMDLLILRDFHGVQIS